MTKCLEFYLNCVDCFVLHRLDASMFDPLCCDRDDSLLMAKPHHVARIHGMRTDATIKLNAHRGTPGDNLKYGPLPENMNMKAPVKFYTPKSNEITNIVQGSLFEKDTTNAWINGDKGYETVQMLSN